jgi:hypothetical protein
MAAKKKTAARKISILTHEGASRRNIPAAESQSVP